ncbi:transposase family protein [Streptomyces sp. NPDC059753]|uniref:transposase family protein n=1 Tax=Streptomyces sp. NPDC059753 TaxID=3346933 RepID=UPI00366170D6
MTVDLLSTARQATCPGCRCQSGRIHGSYLRFPHDLPTAGKFVVVALRVHRFVCAEGSCPRKTFAEQVPGLIPLFATLADSYAGESLLTAALTEASPNARGADLLELAGVRDTLTANGSTR